MNRTGADMAKLLRDHRALMLGCEAIGWLHMTEKASLHFLRHHGGAGVSYDAKWYEQLEPAWSDRLGWLRKQGAMKWPNSLTRFLSDGSKGGREGDPDLVGCLQAGHAMASGIEKNIPSSTSRYLEQDATHMWLATSFGHPVRNLIEDSPDVLWPGGWERLIGGVGKLLDELKQLGENTPADAQSWWDWRETAIGLGGWLRGAFESTLAETRLPNNDVTLWDQSYVAAALFKSAVAGLVLLENTPDQAWQGLKSETRWRVLTIGFGAKHYEARAVRIGDWSGARDEIEGFFEDVRRLIEVDLALGSLMYRDDEILGFTFPGQRLDDENNPENRSVDSAVADKLCDWIADEVNKFAKRRRLETPPQCTLSRESTRSFIRMAREASQLRKQLAVPVVKNACGSGSPEETEEIDEHQGHICPVCQLRFSGRTNRKEANPKQRPCNVCRKRRRGRLDEWLQKPEDTIWVTELADDNDRVAVLTFSFDLDFWLDGSHVDSLRAQSLAEWRRFNPVLYKNPRKHEGPTDNSISAEDAPNDLHRYVEASLGRQWSQAKDDLLFRGLQDGFQHERSWESFYGKVVWDRTDAPSWAKTQDQNALRAQWLVHQLFRKNASPGRVYRFWRTAEAFFDELVPVFRELAATHTNRWRTRRLVLTPHGDDQQQWEDRGTYATRWNDAPLELLYRSESKDFLTICNLARALRPEQQPNDLRDVDLEIEGDHGERRCLKVAGVSTPKQLGAYAPVLILDRSPRRFRVLVPLSAANACIEAAVAKWKKEFGRVWDRMPLRTGVVAFPRMTPFQAVIEATRNLEDDLSAQSVFSEDIPESPSNDTAGTETWRVVESHARDGVTALSLARQDGERELVTVPVKLPDGRPDVFYPYIAVTDRVARHRRDFTTPATENQAKRVYRHVADLGPGDGVHVAPSKLGIVFMDSTARRFEPGRVRYLSDWWRIRETWALLCRTAPNITALRAVWSTLADARERWRGPGDDPCGSSKPWMSLARSVLANDLGAEGAALKTLVETAASGVLEQTLEWHMRVLKLDPEERI